MAESKIEWTDMTWNPVRGCTKVSPGCKFCYAERFAERFRGVRGHPYEYGFDLRLVPEKLLEPLTWSKPRMVFVNSMSDLFHDGIPEDYIEAVITVMEASPWHTYQVLTKRADRMARHLSGRPRTSASARHIWWGVSVENKRDGLPRVEALRNAPAAVRFLSVEPLLEDLGVFDLRGLDWVIVGGESGRGARPMRREWVEAMQQQCAAAAIPFFFKQWGGVHKSRTGRELNGRTYDEMPTLVRDSLPERPTRRQLMRELGQRFEGGRGSWIMRALGASDCGSAGDLASDAR